ncbi:hypothetical protein [Streptomyces litmocidini]|uniref:hypothetical protein n=1 Tax=Streptomyces litmocidini TaxID=67318 RepID=UPI00167D8F0C|nr:hypothetical protein [Streptomyces litmocidini]
MPRPALVPFFAGSPPFRTKAAVLVLHGRTVVALHDEADRVASAADTWAFLAHARAAGARVPGIAMPGGGHVVIRGARPRQRFTAEAVAALLGLAPFPGAPADGAEVFAGPGGPGDRL